MVQVEVFWSYGLNAGLAIAARNSLKNEERWLESKSFLVALLGTAAWLVALFAMTNVTQGVLGFGVMARLVRAGKLTAAWWQALGAHIAMFYILIVGWDGTGYRRFFYAGTGEQWHQGQEFAFVDFLGRQYSTRFWDLV